LIRTLAAALLIVLMLGGCARKPVPLPGPEIEFDSSTFSFDQGTYPTELGLFSDYRLAPGDVLDVLFQFSTWQEKASFKLAVDHTITIHFVHIPELTQTLPVQPDGRISLPYVGETYVVGKTVAQLTQELREAYGKELVDPELYVTVDEFQASIKELKKDLHTAPRGLSRLVSVRPDGYATFPLVGDVFVAHRTLPEVNDTLNDRYNQTLAGLHVDLFLEEHAASQVVVAGDVNKAGAYTITKPITVFEALALAEGHLPTAALEQVLVVRRHNKKFVAHQVDLKGLMAQTEGSAFFYLRPDDLVYVPKRGLSKTALVMDDISRILMFRGWGISIGGSLFDEPIFGNPGPE
jgi:polysaccharide export outer membrane protein